MKHTVIFTEDYAGKKKGDKMLLSHRMAFKLVRNQKVAKFETEPEEGKPNKVVNSLNARKAAKEAKPTDKPKKGKGK